MKKLLSLLGSISLIASTSGVAVSCGASNTRIATPTLNGDRARELIAKLADSSDFGFTFGDLFSDIDITTTIVNEINRFVSINYNFATTNNTLGTLGLNKYELTDGGNKDFETRFDNIIRTVAEDSLFNEYSKTIVDGPSNSFEMSLSKQLYSLNPIATTEVQATDGSIHYVKAGTKIMFGDDKPWQVYGEEDVKTLQTPTIGDLTKEFTDDGVSPFTINAFDSEKEANGDGDGTPITITSKTALELRFQDYFNNKKMYDAMTNALTMVYNQSTMWRTSADGAYFDITNPIFSKTGTWTTSDFHTNVKMVWTYTVPKTAADAVQAALKDTLDADGKFKDGTTGLTDLVKTISGVEAAVTNKDETDGNDPYFGLTGYKGVVVSQDGTTIGDNPISGAAYESAVNATSNLQNRGGITIQNANIWYYQNADNKDNVDFVITLPIFIMQLLGVNKALSPDNKDVTIYTIKGAKATSNPDDGDQKEISFDRSSSSSDADSYTNLWDLNDDYNSKDVDTLASDPVKQESLFQQIQYLVSQDSNGQETAKKVIYSKYLDEDDIYYAGLYDQIGKYISKSDSEDE
jgi:hypothetical protein